MSGSRPKVAALAVVVGRFPPAGVGCLVISQLGRAASADRNAGGGSGLPPEPAYITAHLTCRGDSHVGRQGTWPVCSPGNRRLTRQAITAGRRTAFRRRRGRRSGYARDRQGPQRLIGRELR